MSYLSLDAPTHGHNTHGTEQTHVTGSSLGRPCLPKFKEEELQNGKNWLKAWE